MPVPPMRKRTDEKRGSILGDRVYFIRLEMSKVKEQKKLSLKH